MSSSLLQYRPLFTVEMLHDYYLTEDRVVYGNNNEIRQHALKEQNRNYDIHKDLFIAPTVDCQTLLNNNRLYFKLNSRGFFIGARVREIEGTTPPDYTPFIDLDQPLRLRFVVFAHNPNFYHFTNVNLDKNEVSRDRKMYLFSNQADNVVDHPEEGELLYLNQVLQDFDPNLNYEAGDIILRGTTPIEMYEAIQDVIAGDPFDSVQWNPIYVGQNPHFQFINAADRVLLRPNVFVHNVFSATENHIALNIQVFDRGGTLMHTQHFFANDPMNPLATLRSCTLDLSQLNPGMYRLEVQQLNGTTIPAFGLIFYLDQQLFQQRPLALIECYHEPDGSLNAYRWLDASTPPILLEPVYRLRWKNRSTYWRYHFMKEMEVPTSDSTVEYWNDGTNDNSNVLITRVPTGLTQVVRRVVMDPTGTNEEILLPNPGVSSVFYEGGRAYSEVNMGGGLGPP